MADNPVYTIEDIRRIVDQVSRDFGIKRMAVFGSYTRGEATENSDEVLDRIRRDEVLIYEQ